MSRVAALPKEAPAAPSAATPQSEPSTPTSPKPWWSAITPLLTFKESVSGISHSWP